MRVAHDVHRGGLFPRATWLRLFREVGLAAGFAPRTIEWKEYDGFIARGETPGWSAPTPET